jgi:hypothetical protein
LKDKIPKQNQITNTPGRFRFDNSTKYLSQNTLKKYSKSNINQISNNIDNVKTTKKEVYVHTKPQKSRFDDIYSKSVKVSKLIVANIRSSIHPRFSCKSPLQ